MPDHTTSPRPSSGRDLDGLVPRSRPRRPYSHRVVVADDCPLVRRAMGLLLATTPGLICAGEARSGEAAIRACRRLTPDWLILDYDLGDMTAPDVVEQLHVLPNRPRILLHTGRADAADTAARLGLADGITKGTGLQQITEALLST